MAPINPYAAPPLAPAKPAPAGGAKAPAPGAASGFRPGLDAPRATPRLSGLAAPRKAAANASPAAEGRRLFTMQALSAYAGMVLDADAPGAQAPGGIAGRQVNRAAPGAERPSLPGAKLDLKV